MRKKGETLTADQLRDVLRYEPETGMFFWRRNVNNNGGALGGRAGSVRDNGHRRIGVFGTRYMEQRLAWLYVYGEWPKGIVQHINNDPSDNRISNLREEIASDGSCISLEQLRQMLHYDELTGVFTWRCDRNRGRTKQSIVSVGDVAGNVSTTTGYRFICIERKKYAAHRLAWFYVHGHWPKECIDHINCDRADNRIENLREATRQQNNLNKGPRQGTISGIKGVSWSKTKKMWFAQIGFNGKNHNLGWFKSKELAAKAYRKAAAKFHGDFAWLE